MLIGGLWHLCDLSEFAIEAERAEDFATDLVREREQPGGRQSWRLTLVSLRNAFQTGLSPIPAGPQANWRGSLRASRVAFGGVVRFDRCASIVVDGVPAANASDVQGMITELLHNDAPRPNSAVQLLPPDSDPRVKPPLVIFSVILAVRRYCAGHSRVRQ